MVGGSPFPAGEDKTLKPEKGHTCSYSHARSRFWSVHFSSAHPCSGCIAWSSTFASFDAGSILCQQSLPPELKSCHVSVILLHYKLCGHHDVMLLPNLHILAHASIVQGTCKILFFLSLTPSLSLLPTLTLKH